MSYLETLYRRGLSLHRANNLEGALACYEQALTLRKDYADVLYNRGTALWALGRIEEALASTEDAIKAKPGYFEAIYNRGVMLRGMHRLRDALASFDAVLAIKPDFAPALNNRGGLLMDLGRLEDALSSMERVLAIDPHRASSFYNYGVVLDSLGREEDALRSYDKALILDAIHPGALTASAAAALRLCDFERARVVGERLKQTVADGKTALAPLTFLSYCDDPSLQLKCAVTYMADRIRIRPPPLWQGSAYHHEKIRVAYLSADFRQHPVSGLMVKLIEDHDRNHFDIIGISLASREKSPMGERISRAFDKIYWVYETSDVDAAKLIHSLEIDIAVDLMGHTLGSRPEILSHRPAPVQVNYLGYPGTMGADFIDYVITDPIVVPFTQRPYWKEKIVHLPRCFQPDDDKCFAGNVISRSEAGLPEDGFVFCCFNDTRKITSSVFSIWCKLLFKLPKSVLWLRSAGPRAIENLRGEADRRGIDPQGRLIFAPRLERPQDHLARHKLADLFLDTLPYNAHATANDALQAGVPILTCMGNSYAARVGGSLLKREGLEELITRNLEEYEDLALKLAKDPLLLSSFRNRLRRHRSTSLDSRSDQFRQDIEAAYTRMLEISESGQETQEFGVGHAASR